MRPVVDGLVAVLLLVAVVVATVAVAVLAVLVAVLAAVLAAVLVAGCVFFDALNCHYYVPAQLVRPISYLDLTASFEQWG